MAADREIARRCAVSHEFVGKVRGPICHSLTDAQRKVERNGTVYTQRTENIGRRPTAERVDDIRRMAAQGNRATQIAAEIATTARLSVIVRLQYCRVHS